jgi:hypothetical protein
VIQGQKGQMMMRTIRLVFSSSLLVRQNRALKEIIKKVAVVVINAVQQRRSILWSKRLRSFVAIAIVFLEAFSEKSLSS